MKLIDAYTKLKNLNLPVVHTIDVAAILKISASHANKILSRLTAAGQLVHISRGIWSFADTDPLLLPGFITQPFPTYISLQTALYYHGMVSQIPSTIYAVSIARAKLYKTPLANISIHHAQPSFFFGYEMKANGLIKFATPEKALIDMFYFSQSKSRLFNSMPEVELPKNFNKFLAKKIINKIESPTRKNMVQRKFEEFFAKV